MNAGTDQLRLADEHHDQEYVFETRVGVRSPERFHPAELAVLEHVVDPSPGRLLVLGATYGAVGIPAVRHADRVVMAPFRARARDLCRQNVRLNDVDADVQLIASPTAVPTTVDTVAYAPRSYTPNAVVAQRCLDALELLDSAGRLVLAARDEAGGAAHARTLSEHVDVTETGATGDVTVRTVEAPTGFAAPTLVEDRTFEATIDGTAVTLVSRPGLFSAAALDTGTRLLLETLTVTPGERVLDLAAGYGPIGAYAGVEGGDPVLTEDSRPATRCAERTLAANDVTAPVHTADALDAVEDQRFDLVAANPPTHAGTPVLKALYGRIGDVLSPEGRLRVVHHRSLDVARHLDDRLIDVRSITTGAEHTILGAERP